MLSLYKRANGLVDSEQLKIARYQAFIPDSFLGKKGFTEIFPVSMSVVYIVTLFKRKDLKNIMPIKRVLDSNNGTMDKVEFTFDYSFVPHGVSMNGFLLKLMPAVPRLHR